MLYFHRKYLTNPWDFEAFAYFLRKYSTNPKEIPSKQARQACRQQAKQAGRQQGKQAGRQGRQCRPLRAPSRFKVQRT